MKKRFQIGICYYPATVGLVDDNKEYLKHLLTRLVKLEKIPCFSYEDPEQALQFLTKEYHADPIVNRCLIESEDNDMDHHMVDFNIPAIHQEIYNPRRFAEITVLVIDYAMPGINGLELCRQLREKYPFIKIIMLTGEVGKDLAVEAFNEGSIDRFILKNTPSLMEALVQIVRELQLSYFQNLSELALNKIADFSQQTLVCLTDPVFVDFFQQLCKTNNIVEYYLMDDHGSFLLLDAKGKPSWLAVADNELMESYAELAKHDKAPEALTAALHSKKMMPYFHTEDDFSVRPAEWQEYLHPAQTLQGKQLYYYSYITDPNAYDLESDRVFSFQQYLEKI